MVDIGGRRLHLVCQGSGFPTVIFESGSGEGWYSWALVQGEVAQHFRACSYDRSGIGFSDPDPRPRSVRILVNDLHELLLRSGERGPFVLVGHSLGGLLARRYAMTYRNEVAALVLIDSAHEDAARGVPLKLEAASKKALAARGEQIKKWRASGHFEVMTFHSKLPPALAAQLRPLSASDNWWTARFAENTLPDAEDDLSPEQRHLDIPIVVITATQWPTPSYFPAGAWNQNMANRMCLQEELVARSAQATHLFAQTGHHVQFEDPDLVILAIIEVATRSYGGTSTLLNGRRPGSRRGTGLPIAWPRLDPGRRSPRK
jgi:pimeloyl-ACP methyl ester carboxylesterase